MHITRRAMRHHHHERRPLLRRRSSQPHGHVRPARAIPSRRHLATLGPWRVSGFTLVAIVTAVLFAAMLVVVLRSDPHVIGRLLPGWPWW